MQRGSVGVIGAPPLLPPAQRRDARRCKRYERRAPEICALPRAYRAPEVVLGHPYSPKVDLWSLGCILMELLTNRLLFDNRSVQSLLASHIALLGQMPPRLLADGQLSDYYFVLGASQQTLIGKHDGRICRMRPTPTSLEALCERHGCSDPQFPAFIRALLALDPQARSAPFPPPAILPVY